MRRSLRLRLALWCAALVIVSGAIVVIGLTALTGATLHERAASPPPRPSSGQDAGGVPRPAQVRAADNRRGDVVESTLEEARLVALMVLAGLAVASIGIGWMVAGRMLRPVNALADLARGVSDTSLHRRIALGGPDDELRQLANAFDAMLDRLDVAFGSQQRFVADASHELRTPLATIRAEVESVLEDPDADPCERRATAIRIGHVLDRADSLVDSLLTLARAESIQHRSDADLGELVCEVVTATPAASDLDVRLALGTAPVNGDVALLERLAGNLIENGVRHNVPGGTLWITTAQAHASSVLTVANDGPALQPEEVPRLLDRFHRPHRSGAGFGLGLAIASSIASGHGGTLDVSARRAGGLCVVVSLPSVHVLPDARTGEVSAAR